MGTEHADPMDYKRLAEIKEHLAEALVVSDDEIVVFRQDIEDLIAEIESLQAALNTSEHKDLVRTRGGRLITKRTQREAAKAYVRISKKAGLDIPKYVQDVADES